ncbi:MAG TPA: hypothetical protein VHE81_04730 [Lacipirellulaceae bacterium]|nr:hypothetical protein [Lacipirellulaceae bacterium]
MDFSFGKLAQLSSHVDKVRLTLIGGKTSHDGIGLSFNDFSVFQPILPGDYNDDGVVDAADYVLSRKFAGQSYPLINEDPAASTLGAVDQEDFAYWRIHFGAT